MEVDIIACDEKHNITINTSFGIIHGIWKEPNLPDKSHYSIELSTDRIIAKSDIIKQKTGSSGIFEKNGLIQVHGQICDLDEEVLVIDIDSDLMIVNVDDTTNFTKGEFVILSTKVLYVYDTGII